MGPDSELFADMAQAFILGPSDAPRQQPPPPQPQQQYQVPLCINLVSILIDLSGSFHHLAMLQSILSGVKMYEQLRKHDIKN